MFIIFFFERIIIMFVIRDLLFYTISLDATLLSFEIFHGIYIYVACFLSFVLFVYLCDVIFSLFAVSQFHTFILFVTSTVVPSKSDKPYLNSIFIIINRKQKIYYLP